MPLIIITGLPCSGKTYRTQQLAEYLTQRISTSVDSTSSSSSSTSSKRSVHVVSAHHAASDQSSTSEKPSTARDQIYNSAALEKTARAEEFSAIKRALSRDCIVIADGLNYIKGYRYQLWCEAKAAATRCCVVHVAAREDECEIWNNQRLTAWGRQDEVLEKEEELKPEEHTSKTGRDVRGSLMPESHTAIYGDRLIESDTRSRSSSVDANIDTDIDIDIDIDIDTPPKLQHDDTMTLTSLYIADPHVRAPPSTQSASDQPNSTETSPPVASVSLPTTPLPPPTASIPYAPSTLTSLCMRYEPPSPFTRWDTPLFTLPSSDTHPPYNDIWDAIYPPPTKPTSKKALAQQSAAARLAANASESTLEADQNSPNANKADTVKRHQATILPTATSGDALQILESTTLTIVQTILGRAREMGLAKGEGGNLTLSIPIRAPLGGGAAAPAPTEDNNTITIETQLTLPPGLVLTQPFLQRLRRKYTQIQRGSIAHGHGYAGQKGGRRGVVEGFVGFLVGEFGEE